MPAIVEISRSGFGGDGKPWRVGTEVYGDREIRFHAR